MSGTVRGFLNWLGDVFTDSSKIGYKDLESGKYLEVRSEDDVKVVDGERVPEKIRGSDPGVRSDDLDAVRSYVLEGKSSGQIVSEAADNPYVLSDVISDPGLVDADSPGEAVEAVAEANPGWASMHDVETISGETGTDTSGDIDGSQSPEGSNGVPGVVEGEIDTDTGEIDVDVDTDGSTDSGSSSGGDGGLGDGGLGDGEI
jgi:hypothetical protein